ncbi:MAG: hypothetical protein WA655_17535 [Candidatus Korobacteraceae bacterium]
MRSVRWALAVTALLTLVMLSATGLFAQNPRNPGIFKQWTAPPSSTLAYFASEAGKQALLHSSNPAARGILARFHPDAVGQYPQQPLVHADLASEIHPPVSVTGCGTASGTVMNLEAAANAVAQRGPSVDFLLSELGSGKDLVVESGYDSRLGSFDSYSGIYVHRDPSQSCYGGTDFEMGNYTIANPFDPSDMLIGMGGARVLADANSSHKQFIFADLRADGEAAGVGLRRVPASNFENTSTCPAGTLTFGQEATCQGATAILVDPSVYEMADSVSIAQDPRSSGTGAGDIYVVNTQFGSFGSVIHLTACKATFSSISDCAPTITVSGSQNQTQFPSVAVIAGGSNAGTIVISYGYSPNNVEFVSCTPHGAPTHPTCGSHHLVRSDTNVISTYFSLADNPGLALNTWPVIAARTDSGGGQTIFIVWADCKVPTYSGYPVEGCIDADIVMAVDTSLSSPSFAFHHVSTSSGHQIMPAIAYDTGQNIVTIAYYSTKSDAYKNKVVMEMNQIASGSITVGSTVDVTTSYDSIAGDGTNTDSFDSNPMGDFTGLAAHGGSGAGSSRVYLGFTNNARMGTYTGISNTQADNNVSRVTY